MKKPDKWQCVNILYNCEYLKHICFIDHPVLLYTVLIDDVNLKSQKTCRSTFTEMVTYSAWKFCLKQFYSAVKVLNDQILLGSTGSRPHPRPWLDTQRASRPRPLDAKAFIVSAYRYIATANLPIIVVFGEYLRQFLIDLHQIYRHSSVPKTRLREFFELLSSSGFRARRRREFFCHVVPVTVYRTPRLPKTSILWLN